MSESLQMKPLQMNVKVAFYQTCFGVGNSLNNFLKYITFSETWQSLYSVCRCSCALYLLVESP